MTEIPNPYQEGRNKSPGELAQEYDSLMQMAFLLFGVTLTEREKAAVPVLVGAFMRERHKIDLQKIQSLLDRFLK